MDLGVFVKDITVHDDHLATIILEIDHVIPKLVPFHGMGLFVDTANDVGVDFVSVLAVGLDGTGDEVDIRTKEGSELFITSDFFGGLGDNSFLEVVREIGGR